MSRRFEREDNVVYLGNTNHPSPTEVAEQLRRLNELFPAALKAADEETAVRLKNYAAGLGMSAEMARQADEDGSRRRLRIIE